MASTATSPPGILPCARSNSRRTSVEQRQDHHLGQRRIGRAGRRARRSCRQARGRRSGTPVPGRRCGRGRARPRSRRPGQATARSAPRGFFAPAPGRRRPARSARRAHAADAPRYRRGAAPSPSWSASRPSRPGLELSSEKSCTPAGSRARKRSKAAKAASALFVVASASISAGTNSVSRSRAVAERIAG